MLCSRYADQNRTLEEADYLEKCQRHGRSVVDNTQTDILYIDIDCAEYNNPQTVVQIDIDCAEYNTRKHQHRGATGVFVHIAPV